MRRLRLAVIGPLAFLLVTRFAVAATAIYAVSHGRGSPQPPFPLPAEASGQNKFTTSTNAAGNTFQNFGHNVANGAKVGGKFGALPVGRFERSTRSLPVTCGFLQQR